jgi:ribosomal protein S18 acetylase RimI-like enzyme
MSDYEFPAVPDIEAAYRTAYRALAGIIPRADSSTSEAGLSVTELISHFRFMAEEAEMAAAARLGPLISWEAPRPDGDWELVMTGADLDNGLYDFGVVALEESAFQGHGGGWSGGSLERAARAYKRAARWDFAPGEAGVWLLMLAPTWASGGEPGPMSYSGHLAGFVIHYDRDKDGAYESVGHIWTAAAWRRRGIARSLLAEAKSRFKYTRIEGPYTKDGGALVEATRDLSGGSPKPLRRCGSPAARFLCDNQLDLLEDLIVGSCAHGADHYRSTVQPLSRPAGRLHRSRFLALPREYPGRGHGLAGVPSLHAHCSSSKSNCKGLAKW